MGMAERVLVTGAGGFIGSHLVERLVERGYAVRALVHYNSAGHWSNLELAAPDVREAIEVVAGDVTDSFQLEEAVRGCSMVFHLAALIASRIPIAPPARTSPPTSPARSTSRKPVYATA